SRWIGSPSRSLQPRHCGSSQKISVLSSGYRLLLFTGCGFSRRSRQSIEQAVARARKRASVTPAQPVPIVRHGCRVHAAATNWLIVVVCAGHRPCPASGSAHLTAPGSASATPLSPTVREDSPCVGSHAAAVRHGLGTRRRAPTMSGGLLRQARRRPRAHLLVPGF